MSDLRARLAAKQRRRVSYPVQVANPGPAAERVDAASQALTATLGNSAATDEDLERARAEVADARAALQDCFLSVDFQALPPADFEALFTAHLIEDDSGKPVPNRDALLPALAAACAVDEDLRDEEWWVEQLHGGDSTWTPGELDQLYALLYSQLHYQVPRGLLGKG